MSRTRRQDGVTLIEVIVTMVIILVGLMATLGVFTTAGSATFTAQRKAAVVALAQRDLERIRPTEYASLGLSGTPNTTIRTKHLKNPAKSETDVIGGTVNPGPEDFQVEGIKGKVYRYVTWRGQACPTVHDALLDSVAAQTGVPTANVSSAVSDICSQTVGTQQTKRLTVIFVPDTTLADESGPFEPVQVSTIASNPDEGAIPVDADVPLAIDTEASKAAKDLGADHPNTVYEGVSQQIHYLHDTRCGQVSRQAIIAEHSTNDTSVRGATCSGSAQPDLMSTTAIPGDPSVLHYDYSTDVTRKAKGGLALQRDDRTGPCDSTFDYEFSQATRRAKSLHTWASPPTTADAETSLEGGRAVFTMFTQTADAVDEPAKLCVTLWQQSNQAVLGSTDFTLPTWPGEITQLSVAFDVAHVNLPVGDRLMLTLRTRNASENDVVVHYDHPSYPSSLTVAMVPGKEMKP